MAATSATVKILHEVSESFSNNEWKLCFQYCEYQYSNDVKEFGYRFIWRRPDGTLQAARGQAMIPSLACAMRLMAQALTEGWGNHDCVNVGHGILEQMDEATE